MCLLLFFFGNCIIVLLLEYISVKQTRRLYIVRIYIYEFVYNISLKFGKMHAELQKKLIDTFIAKSTSYAVIF